MSNMRIAAHAAVVAVGALASLALMATPSWAARNSANANSPNAKLCQPGGHLGVLFAQAGSTFEHQGNCTSYAAKDGQLAELDVGAGSVEQEQMFKVSCSGVGLDPGTTAECGVGYGEGGGTVIAQAEVAADGTVSLSESFSCVNNPGSNATGVFMFAKTAGDQPISMEQQAPSECSSPSLR